MNHGALGALVAIGFLLLGIGIVGKLLGVSLFKLLKGLIRVIKKILRWLYNILVSLLGAMGIKFFRQIATPTRVMNRFHERLEKIRDEALDKRWNLLIKECGLTEPSKWWSLFYNIDNENTESIQESFKDLFDMQIPDSKTPHIRELVIYMIQNKCKQSIERSFKIYDKLLYEIAYRQSVEYENITLSSIPDYG